MSKLAVGGAVAAGGSLVLSSNAVAQTASGPILGIPPAGAPLPAVITEFVAGGNTKIRINAVQPVTCAGPESPSTTYSWRIWEYSVFAILPGSARVVIRNSTDTANVLRGPAGTATCASPCTGYSPPSTNGEVVIERRVEGILLDLDWTFTATDNVVIDLLVTWQCGATTVTAEYRYERAAGPTMENLSYLVS